MSKRIDSKKKFSIDLESITNPQSMRDEIKLPSSRRDQNSLFNLTKKFIKLLTNNSDQTMNITRAAELLGVEKRRIYDIINVLLGVNFLTKQSTNMVKWNGDNPEDIFGDDSDDGDIFSELDKQTVANSSISKNLDNEIDKLSNELEILSNASNRELAFITYDDTQLLPELRNKLIFAVKASPETLIERPVMDDDLYYVSLKSDKDPISMLYIDTDDVSDDHNNQ